MSDSEVFPDDKEYSSGRPFESVGRLGAVKGGLKLFIQEGGGGVVVWDSEAEEIVLELDREQQIGFKELLEEGFDHPSRDDNPYNRVGGRY